jgi:hypothetical protein
MGRKMVVRILSISIALLFLGVFLPSLTNGAVEPPPVDPVLVDFGEVEVGSQGFQHLSIYNSNEDPEQVIFFISYDNGGPDCGFSLALTPAPGNNNLYYLPGELEGKGSVDVEVIFSPTDPPAACSATLMVSVGGVANATLLGTGVEAKKLTNIIIDEQDTGVLDFELDGKLFSMRLDEIAAKARNHGQYVRWVFFWTRRAHKNDMLDREQMKAILKAAAHAKIPKDGVIKGRKEKHHNGRHAGRFGFHGGHHK